MDTGNLNLQDEFKIAPSDIRGSVEILKEGRIFMNSLPGGEIPCRDMGGLGLYFADTRFLSCLEMQLNDTEPVFLSRTLTDSHFAQVEMTNKEFNSENGPVPMQSIHFRIFRLVKDAYYLRIRIINFNMSAIKLCLRFNLAADYADIFEVRGTNREMKGTMLKPQLTKKTIQLKYLGRDQLQRSTVISFNPAPDRICEAECTVKAEYELDLEPKKQYHFYLKVVPVLGSSKKKHPTDRKDLGFAGAAGYLVEEYRRWQEECLQIASDNERFNILLKTSVTDLRALSTTYPGVGRVIEAGIPWYAAPFGRDSLIAAWQSLIVNPSLAKETIAFLAKYQGQTENSWRDEQPGKIMHELRFGEMAANGEVPHTPYYGSVDATPWFIILLAEYIKWTGDFAFYKRMSGAMEKALSWCEKYGDLDEDGYIEYSCRSERGLLNQGWKDSWDGVINRDGTTPSGPIALVEVQAYYYSALKGAADLYEQAGELEKAETLRRRAACLQKKFVQDFWQKRNGFLAYFLNGEKQPIKTVVSNPGHCLFTGILPEEMACRVVERLARPDLFSGWGIRTMSDQEKLYNPLSYHNGTIWPHDNSIIGYGMRKVGILEPLIRMVENLFEAAQFFTHYRLPELFCGFNRRGIAGPAKYPIACDPQAWSVGSMFILLRALLGIECRGNDVHVTNPQLPGFLNYLQLKNLRAGNGTVNLDFARKDGITYCSVVKTSGSVRVIFEKEL